MEQTLEKKSIHEDRYYRPDNFPKGLTRKVVESISHIKNEPGWLTSFRLKAFEIYEQKPMPTWGFCPNFNVDIDSYTHYIGSNQQKKNLGTKLIQRFLNPLNVWEFQNMSVNIWPESKQ
ncbi:hypothetical protein LEP1GSC029_4137 [Leptospira interrogans str. 2002000626]|uniref:Fe-S cluster assembly protein SufB n=1 Tax=Leptospira interrogans str. 2002000626 TaxID=996803 RepID=A0A829D629_LEPIR|nr:hypothetical protein LEP1GSC029_4137 [Leptospira interrogans str. 2002000626]